MGYTSTLAIRSPRSVAATVLTGGLTLIAAVLLGTTGASALIFSSGNVSPTFPSVGDTIVNTGSINVGTGAGTNTLTIDSNTLTLNEGPDPVDPLQFDGVNFRVGTNQGTGGFSVINGGTLNVNQNDSGRQNGARLYISDTPGIGGPASLAGSVLVDDGAINVFSASEQAGLTIGQNGTGSMTMRNGAAVSVRSSGNDLSYVNVGRDGTGTLGIQSGSTLRIGTDASEAATASAGAGMSIGIMPLGGVGGGTGTVTVDGGTLKIRNSGTDSSKFAYLNVGFDTGSGELTVENGGQVDIADIGAGQSSLNVGRNGVNGTMTIRDAGSSVSVGNFLNVGLGGIGTVNVSDSGSFHADQMFIGRDGGVGTVNVSGVTTNFDLSAGSLVGFTSTGTMNITDEAKVDAADFIVVGRSAGGIGNLTVDGSGSQLNLTGLDAVGDGPGLVIGLDGSGFMTVRNGAVVTVDSGAPVTGANTGGIALGGAMTATTSSGFGRLDIDGVGSAVNLLTPDAEVHVGRQGTGIVNVTGGGIFTASADGVIGREVGSVGVLNVLGAGSQAGFGDHLFIGTDVDLASNTATGPGGSGIVNVGSGGILSAVNTVIGSGGILKGSGGTVNGNVTVAGGIFAPGNSPGTMTVNGDLILDSGMLQLETEGGVSDEIVVNGSVLIGAGAMIELLFDTVPTAIDLADFFTVGDPLNDIVFDSGFGIGNITVLATAPGGAGMTVDVTYGGTTTAFVAASVPEPATLALFCFALAGLGFAGRSRCSTGATIR